MVYKDVRLCCRLLQQLNRGCCGVARRYPANVLSGFEPAAGAGATFFHLNDLQVRRLRLWPGLCPQMCGQVWGQCVATYVPFLCDYGSDQHLPGALSAMPPATRRPCTGMHNTCTALRTPCTFRVGTLYCHAQDEYRNEPGSVITADFYNASALLPLTDEAIVQRVKSHLVTCEPGFRGEYFEETACVRCGGSNQNWGLWCGKSIQIWGLGAGQTPVTLEITPNCDTSKCDVCTPCPRAMQMQTSWTASCCVSPRPSHTSLQG